MVSHQKTVVERTLVVVFAGLLLSSGAAGGVAALPTTDDAADRTVEVVIVFENFDARNASIVRDAGGTVTNDRSVSLLPVLSASLPERAVERLEQNPGVSSVERNRQYSLREQTTPWGVDRVGGAGAAASVNDSDEAKVSVAVVDTGIDSDHPDLDDNVAWGVNTVGSGSPDYGTQAADDDNGHGTFAAGVVAAEDNDRGVVGVTPNARLYSIKALNESGTGTMMDIIEGIDEATKGPDGVRGTDDDPDVISMSFGSKTDSRALEDAVERASQSSILVAAAGNAGDGDASTSEVRYPARYDSVVAVAATNENDETTTWSAEGPAVELAAPGSGLTSTYDGGYARASGTSFAAPHVSAVAALLVADDLADGSRDLSDGAVRTTLRDTALDIEADGTDNRSGHGLVRADAALNVSDGAESNTEPTVALHRPNDGATVDGTVTVRVGAADEEDATSALDVDVAIDGGSWTDATYDSSADAFVVDWDTRTASEDERHSITARVRDGDGATAEETISVVVDNANAAPRLEFRSPEESETVGGTTTVVLNATDSEDDASALDVAVSVDDGPWRSATYDAGTDRHRFEWNASNVTDGATHTVRARATDTDGATAEASVNVSVDATDDEPSVDVVAPGNASTVAGQVPIRAVVSDDRTTGADLTVEYRVDAGDWHPLSRVDGRWQARFDTLTVPDGSHAVSVRVRDGTQTVVERREFAVANARLASTDGLALTATADRRGDEVTAEFVATNAGNDSKNVALLLTAVPGDWRIASQQSDGQWTDRRESWVWIEPVGQGESVTATVTFAVPENASASGALVGGVAVDQDDNRQGGAARVAASGDLSIPAAVAGEDGRVQIGEVLQVIDHFNAGSPVPNTGGAVPTVRDVLRVIEYFDTGERVPR